MDTDIRYINGLPDAPFKKKTNETPDYKDDDILLVSSLEFKTDPLPVKVPRNVFFFCHGGNVTIETPEGHYRLGAGDTFICPTGTAVKVCNYTKETKFSVLMLTDRIVRSLLNTNVAIWNNIMYVMRERFIPHETDGEPKERRRMGWLFSEMLRTLLSMRDKPFRKEMIYLMLQMALLGFCAHYKESTERQTVGEGKKGHLVQGQLLFSRFMELLEDEKIKHRPVSYYAEKLFISSKYLSYACKVVGGKPAAEVIRSAVMGEAMHYLDHTTLSVKEIASRMGFANVSFFGKYVKNYLGVSPNKYRK